MLIMQNRKIMLNNKIWAEVKRNKTMMIGFVNS